MLLLASKSALKLKKKASKPGSTRMVAEDDGGLPHVLRRVSMGPSGWLALFVLLGVPWSTYVIKASFFGVPWST